MKSERAKQYLKNTREEIEINWKTGESAWIIWPKNAKKAVELAEREAEKRMRAKAHKIIKEMMEGVFQGNMPQNIADEFSQKLNEE